MSCPCDQWLYPPARTIGAGLETIPRQVADFPAFRRAMLASLAKHAGCHLRSESASDDKPEEAFINEFKKEFESKKDKECAVLIVRAASDSEKWTIAGFNDAGEFSRIDEPSHKLSNELKKEPINESKIVALALADLGRTQPSGWHCQAAGDLGMMLIEMWAYVCDVLAFYDQIIAEEAYLRTARRRGSMRKLVGRLGYLPRPAVAATVTLAAVAEGRQPVRLPAGTAFRSRGFDGEPPQVFELDQETAIHPLTNSWAVETHRPQTLGDADLPTLSKAKVLHRFPLHPLGSMSRLFPARTAGMPIRIDRLLRDRPTLAALAGGAAAPTVSRSEFLLDPKTADLAVGECFLLQVAQSTEQVEQASEKEVYVVSKVSPYQDEAGAAYTKAEFEPPAKLLRSTKLSAIHLTKPTQRAGLWTIRSDPDKVPSTMTLEGDSSQIVLDGLYRQIRPGGFVLVSKEEVYRWFQVLRVEETMQVITNEKSVRATDADGEPILGKDDQPIYCPVPAVTAPATKLFLNGKVAWDASQAGEITVHYGLVEAGEVTAAASSIVGGDTTLALATSATKPIETPPDGVKPTRFLIVDKDGDGTELQGVIAFPAGELKLDSPLISSLRPPLQVFGNLIRASRGERVYGEILGSGNAAMSGQAFKLKKKPLTYLAAPTAKDPRGVSSTLKVWVDGIQWQEVPSFFGQGPEASVYIVRQNDAGESLVAFGDGRRGRRLPTGINNVMAAYRFGAGAKAPPAGGITQLAKPVKGLSSVRNPLPASGGADAEDGDELRTRGPRSALVLGRAVSIQDFEAVASSVAGVRAACAEWRWNATRQRPVVQIWYIGAGDLLTATVTGTLRNLSDPDLALDVWPAEPLLLTLSLDIEVDPRYREEVVLTALRQSLLDPKIGLLAPERIGIGKPLYRSQLFAQVLSLPGPLAVRDIQWDGRVFEGLAISPGGGRYFDLEGGKLILNGREDFSG